MLHNANESDRDEAPEPEVGAAEPARGAGDPDPALRWLYTPDLTSETGWDAYYIRSRRATRQPAGFRPVRVRGDDGAGRSR